MPLRVRDSKGYKYFVRVEERTIPLLRSLAIDDEC